jgi:very-short-patch-repair endonuclease/DNA-directed RNA polymerase subunit RPC12/RpoP
MRNDNYSKNNHCKCGKLISNNATNCYSCEHKRRNKLGIINVKGENNPNFRNGRYYFKHCCIDCGKEIDKKGRSKRCPECYHKSRKNKSINHKKDCKCCCCRAKRGEYKGKNNAFFKGNKALKRQKYKCIDCGKKISNHQHKRCPSCANIESWKNKTIRIKRLKATLLSRLIKPNKPERLLGMLLGKDYKFVGDGKVILGGFCPDFINCNGQKKIVELYGDYWHTKDQYAIDKDKRRLKEYSKLGYSTLIIWEKELKNINKLTNKLKKFREKIKEFNNV